MPYECLSTKEHNMKQFQSVMTTSSSLPFSNLLIHFRIKQKHSWHIHHPTAVTKYISPSLLILKIYDGQQHTHVVNWGYWRRTEITLHTYSESANIWKWWEITFAGEILTFTELTCILLMLLGWQKQREWNGHVA